ncbi:hypothetical protein NDU88_000192 [Pleurodeles waltl]|uniref:Uncharacterized protein n=1 Tax=Pleurodeles waltl TaxID=8319 RepID=A0AAV7U2R8_PLEWA|nr:hypothetical protein NDU88_000192 [Pleurodeles waltl]
MNETHPAAETSGRQQRSQRDSTGLGPAAEPICTYISLRAWMNETHPGCRDRRETAEPLYISLRAWMKETHPGCRDIRETAEI